MNHKNVVAPLLLSLTLLGQVVAAPTTETQPRDGDGSAGQRNAQGLPEIAGVSDGQGNSRTVRMLLELQNAPPPLEGTSDTRRVDNKAKNAAARAGGDVVISGPEAAANHPAVDWRSGLPGRTVNSQNAEGGSMQVVGREASARTAARETPRQMADDQLDVKTMLPRRVLAFLREHREWVLAGSLGLLALVWLAASTLSQRRR